MFVRRKGANQKVIDLLIVGAGAKLATYYGKPVDLPSWNNCNAIK
jgi:hypothetical protein